MQKSSKQQNLSRAFSLERSAKSSALFHFSMNLQTYLRFQVSSPHYGNILCSSEQRKLYFPRDGGNRRSSVQRLDIRHAINQPQTLTECMAYDVSKRTYSVTYYPRVRYHFPLIYRLRSLTYSHFFFFFSRGLSEAGNDCVVFD